MSTFEQDLAKKTEALEAAREGRAKDPEKWAKVSTDFAEWRRAIRMLGGRPLGDPPYPPDVQAFADAQEGWPMSWSASKWFYQTVLDGLGNVTALDLDADVPKIALYNDSITPDATVSAANSAYNAGVWATGANNISDATGWPAAGRPLVSATWTKTSNVLTYDANGTVSANATTTLAAFYGVLNYDDTLAAIVVDQGISFNYLGGSNSITSGTMTVVWNASGICALTL